MSQTRKGGRGGEKTPRKLSPGGKRGDISKCWGDVDREFDSQHKRLLQTEEKWM